MMGPLVLLGFAWVGHAAWLVRILNTLYALAIPKWFLKPWRHFTGLLIVLFPLLGWWWWVEPSLGLLAYFVVCHVVAAFTIIITVLRALRPKPSSLVSSTSTIHALPKVIGDGKNRWMARLPLNQAFDVEVTELTLKLKWLPKELQNLSVLMLSDLHFHGTPGREWFDQLFDLLKQHPKPDIVALVGDFVDSDTHHTWLAPLLGSLQWNELGVAILGNHDNYHQPDQLREELTRLGYTVLGNRWERVTVRGVPIIVFGDERPWFNSKLDVRSAPIAGFRLYLSHSPDNFPTAHAAMCDLVLAGHVHGGGIRVPGLGSIFVPSVFGRAYDCGVFEWDRTVMVVGRGLSGKEPIRWNCRPQVLRLTLVQG
jgi:uncharacterized protein